MSYAIVSLVYVKIYIRKKFHKFYHLLSLANVYHANILSSLIVNATFTTIGENLSILNVSVTQRFLFRQNFHEYDTLYEQLLSILSE